MVNIAKYVLIAGYVGQLALVLLSVKANVDLGTYFTLGMLVLSIMFYGGLATLIYFCIKYKSFKPVSVIDYVVYAIIIVTIVRFVV